MDVIADKIKWNGTLEKRVVIESLTRFKHKIPASGNIEEVPEIQGWLECWAFIKTECKDLFVDI